MIKTVLWDFDGVILDSMKIKGEGFVSLFKEFDEYANTRNKLKVFRLEAIRAGFRRAWQNKDYSTIISVAKKIPHTVLEEDQHLLMWFDQAMTRLND